MACCESKSCQGCDSISRKGVASSEESATSNALLLRAFTDSSEVPILSEDNLR